MLPQLHEVPVYIDGWPPVFVDLRTPGSFSWFAGSPWAASPRETHEQRIIERVVRRGDVAIDIGANIGLHLVLLSHLVGPEGLVSAFEPNPDLQHTLQRTASTAGNVRLYPVALSDRDTDANLFVPADHSMASLENWSKRQRAQRSVPCHLRRLDDLLASGPRPHFIKCDVEGAELQVFRGAERILNVPDAPVVLFEANPYATRAFGITQWDAMRFLEQLAAPQFTAFMVAPDGRLERPDLSIGRTVNILAVPAHRLSTLQ